MREKSPRDASPLAASLPGPVCAAPRVRPTIPAASPRLTPRRLLACMVLLGSVFVSQQAAAQAPASGSAVAPPDGAVPLPDGVAMPPRMPRPGSSRTFEHSGTPRLTAEQRFEAANTTRDGHLTESQAQAAHLRGVATHFSEIDKSHRGYITFDEILTWRAERKAAREKAEK